MEKYRDVKKMFQKNQYRCLILGVEEQDKVHYAMPIRTMVYDAMSYHQQLKEIQQKNRKNTGTKNIPSDEFLSGFYKNDKIFPVITLVVYLGTHPWDGPRSLNDMFAWTGEDAANYIQNYQLNLLIPSEMDDTEIEKLQSSLREVFFFLKYSKDWEKLRLVLHRDERFHSLEKDAAVIIKELTNTNIKINEKEEVHNMCEAIEQMQQQAEEKGKKIGLENGKRIGQETGKLLERESIIINMYQKGYASSEIAALTNTTEENVNTIIFSKLKLQ